MKTILFVCTGNTCRSSMAEALFKSGIKEYKDRLSSISAGIAAQDGEGANPKAIRVLEEMGIDLKDHRATLLNNKIIESADLILTMTKNHKDMVLLMAPNAIDKTHTLTSYALGGRDSDAPDISDPFGGSIDTYRESAKEIKGYLDKIIKALSQDA